MHQPAQRSGRAITKKVIGLAMRLCPQKKKAPKELQQAINACTTMDQLLALLFSLDYPKDEAIIKAFDRRIDQLEKAGHSFPY